jgi:hypothetical protein
MATTVYLKVTHTTLKKTGTYPNLNFEQCIVESKVKVTCTLRINLNIFEHLKH